MSTRHDPLVSIICFCRNRASTIRRCVESVLGQSYANIEFVVQDGASTDGTLEILREYADRDDRVKLISEPDSGPAEAFWKVLHRCEGEIMGTCLSDEELLPDAIAYAVGRFRDEPKLGALTCDGYITDEAGHVTGDFKAGPFDFVAYLFSRYCPFWPGTFFRRRALLDIGLLDSKWNTDCIEFEVWCRLATDHEVKYEPRPISKYAVHPTQASNTPANFNEHLRGRLALIEKMFSPEGFFGADEYMKLECMINQVYLFYNHANAYNLQTEAAKFGAHIHELEARRDRLGLLFNPYRLGIGAQASAAISEKAVSFIGATQRATPPLLSRMAPRSLKSAFIKYSVFATTVLMTGRLPLDTVRARTVRAQVQWTKTAIRLPSGFRRLLPQRAKNVARHALLRASFALPYLFVAPMWIAWRLRRRSERGKEAVAAPEPSRLLAIYPPVALLYDGRGQIRQALELWRCAEPLNDATIDGMACQAILKLPDATYADIANLQQRWADNHAKPIASRAGYRFPAYDDQRRLRVGYHCAFMEGDTIRFIMRNVFAAHDRSKFELFGYAPGALSEDIRSAFDHVRDTTFLDAEAFIDLVRRNRIDVFVELSGFSPGHRYVEMASRCAPVQVSYLNHHGTSRIPAVDYFLSDEISTPSGSAADFTFTERIYRLPKCLLCYDYEGNPHPPVADPPSRANGFVTFGCFGSGSKINTDLIELWAKLLHRVPGSIFYVRNGQLSAADNRRYLESRFRWFGIGPERLRMDGVTDRMSLLRCYDDVDVTLDTWPYCGGNTVAESLWQGVPVVTLQGTRISSRYGASLLVAAGCGELVATTADDYIEIAAGLARDPDRLSHLRRNLRAMCKRHGLGNSERFARDLEQFYLDAMRERDFKERPLGNMIPGVA